MKKALSDEYLQKINIKGKGKVVYGQEPPSEESTTTECRFKIINYLQ